MSHFADSEIVIIGGGAIGCGVAYSLASAGHSDVLLIEREGDVADRFTESAWSWDTARRQAQHVYETNYALEA